MNFEKQLRSLCVPAHVYFIISIISILAMLSQNIMSDNIYTIGHVKTIMPVSNIITFAFKILYILYQFIMNFKFLHLILLNLNIINTIYLSLQKCLVPK